MAETSGYYVRAAKLAEVETKGSLLVNLEKHTIALFYSHDRVYAIDNRCPHMGFPLQRWHSHLSLALRPL